MRKIVTIFYYLFYRCAKFAKDCFGYGLYLFWGAVISVIIVWNYIATAIEWVLGMLHLQHNDWYYIIIGISITFLLSRFALTGKRYAQLDEKYTKSPIKYKKVVDILIPILFILSFVVQFIVSDKYDVREYINLRDELFH